ncbi:NADPH-dependent F420 reductase [uncultured Cohaesibacter sp.]|uniref:NADPH-dependent F420 reductase n=1 Tax=uncultured Cohaesibacter sp. TaxID=1002546 RepID=UPI0029C836F6|nr:NADPH-dependent F420 reductase [uncultured Cohaesibacter sp.]
MQVAILGAGSMGSGLASLIATAGHEVTIGARDIAKAVSAAEAAGSSVNGGGIAAASQSADIIILALPYGAVPAVLKEAGDLTGKVVIDITNPITEDFKGLTVGHTSSAAEEIQKFIPSASVVKAFNTIFAALLPSEARANAALQVFVASDEDGAKQTVTELVSSIGFEPVDAGPLANARFLEPIGEMNIHFGFFLGRGPTVAPAWIAPSAS